MDLLFGFKGRINRARFWLALLLLAVSWLVLWMMIAAAVGRTDSVAVMLVAAAIPFALVIVSSIAVGIKRLHDHRKSGWWLPAFYVAPAALDRLGRLIADADPLFQGAAALICLASLGISIWAFIELGCLRGTAGANVYGPDPLAARARAARWEGRRRAA